MIIHLDTIYLIVLATCILASTVTYCQQTQTIVSHSLKLFFNAQTINGHFCR